MKLMTILVYLLGGTLIPAAVNFEWNSDENGVNRQSDGVTPMDNSFEFVIGNFSAGFDPETRDKDEWVDHFEILGTTQYGALFPERFITTTSIESNDSPFGLADDVYIWGRNGTESGSEWILVNSDSWSWPEANPIGPPIPVTIGMGTAVDDEALVGSVNSGGAHMQSEKVVFELSYAVWAEGEFEPGEASARTDDPDGDGNDNFFEFAVGSNPKKKDAGGNVSISTGRAIHIKRPQGRQVTWKIEASDDMTNFTELIGGYEIAIDTSDELVFQITESLTARRFYRAVAE